MKRVKRRETISTRNRKVRSSLSSSHLPSSQIVIERLCELFPGLKAAQELALELAKMIRPRLTEYVPVWLRAAAQNKLKESVGFARGIREDYEAEKNALTYDWSNGQLEGQVNRLRLLKRGMSRAKFDLLRARVLHSAK